MQIIHTVDLKSRDYAIISGFRQWDKEQILQITGLELPEGTEVHFSLQEAGGTAAVKGLEESDGGYKVKIPQFIFEADAAEEYDAYAFIYQTDGEAGETTHKIRMHVRARPKPDDYVYGEDEVLTWKTLDERITKVEKMPLAIHTAPVYSMSETDTGIIPTINLFDLKPYYIYGVPTPSADKRTSMAKLVAPCEDGTIKTVAILNKMHFIFASAITDTVWTVGLLNSDIAGGGQLSYTVDFSDISTSANVVVTSKPIDFISKTNTKAYTPTADYHPATKKYVDDTVKTSSGKELIADFGFYGYGEGGCMGVNQQYVTDSVKRRNVAGFDGTPRYFAVSKPLLGGLDEFTISFDCLSNGTYQKCWAVYIAGHDNPQVTGAEDYLGIAMWQEGINIIRGTDRFDTGVIGGYYAGNWNHIDVVFRAYSSELFVNGESFGYIRNTRHISDLLGEASAFYIGKANWGGGEYFDGRICDFKVYNYALTAEEIKDNIEG